MVGKTTGRRVSELGSPCWRALPPVRSIASVLVLLGASHHDLALTQLQALAGGAVGLGSRLVAANGAEGPSRPESTHSTESPQSTDAAVAGVVVLVTCNRMEIYLDAGRFHDAVDAVTADLAMRTGVPIEAVAAQLTVRVGTPVVEHLFAVAAGLDSMVVGEAEIAGQVSRALHAASVEGTASSALHQLFQRASRTAKRVQSATSLGAAGRSVASVALDVVEEVHGPLLGKNALIIGTGAYARLVATALRARGCVDLEVFSGSNRADAFAARHSARPVIQDELPMAVKSADVVIACSGSSGAVLTRELLEGSGRDRPLPVVDLALRSDVAPDLRGDPLVDIVDLLTVDDSSPDGDAPAVLAAQDLVSAAVAEFQDSQTELTIDPAVVALRTHVGEVVQREVDRLRGRFDDEVADELELALRRVTRTLLHTPTVRARQLARTGDTADYVAALHTLFGIDVRS